jgi:2-polyprenyl-6-methoxyphenol hydroxylase-like FAD-dependent oxidoreductase
MWCDRKMLLQTLYDNIADKWRLLAQKRIATVQNGEDKVEVITTDGSVYQGDILIGTDGTHSRVREEMVRLANEQGAGPEYADGDSMFDLRLPIHLYWYIINHPADVSSTYACLFGLSSAVPGLSSGLLGWNLGKNYSYVVGTGLDNRTYWLLATKLDKTYHGTDIPHFSKEDEEQIVQEHWNDHITPDLRMSDLYKARQHLVCTPLREIMYHKWSLNRMIVLGDASHTVRRSRSGFICVTN